MRQGGGELALLTQIRMSKLPAQGDFYDASGKAGQFLVLFEDSPMKTQSL